MKKTKNIQSVNPILVNDKGMPHEEVINKILSFIKKKSLIDRKIMVLDGKEGSGKSSILKTVKERELKNGYFFIELDSWLTTDRQAIPIILSSIVHALLESEEVLEEDKSPKSKKLTGKDLHVNNLFKRCSQYCQKYQVKRKRQRLLREINEQPRKRDAGPELAYTILLYGSLLVMWGYTSKLPLMTFTIWQLVLIALFTLGAFFSRRVRELLFPFLSHNHVTYEDPLEVLYLNHEKLKDVCADLITLQEKNIVIFVENIDRLRPNEQHSYLNALYVIIHTLETVQKEYSSEFNIWWILSLDMKRITDHSISEGLFEKLSPYRVYLPGMTRRLAEKVLAEYFLLLEAKNPLRKYPDTSTMMKIFADVWESLDSEMLQVTQLYEPRTIIKYFTHMQVFSQTNLQEIGTYTKDHDRAMKIICATAALNAEEKILKQMSDEQSYFARQSDAVRTYIEIWLKNLSYPSPKSLSAAWMAGDSAHILQYCGSLFSEVIYKILRDCFESCLKNSKKDQIIPFLATSVPINHYFYQHYHRPIISLAHVEVIASKIRQKDWTKLSDSVLGHLYALSPQVTELSQEVRQRIQKPDWSQQQLQDMGQFFIIDPHLDYVEFAAGLSKLLTPEAEDFAHNYEQILGKRQGSTLEKIFWNYADPDIIRSYTKMGTNIYRGNIALRGLACVFSQSRAEEVGLKIKNK